VPKVVPVGNNPWREGGNRAKPPAKQSEAGRAREGGARCKENAPRDDGRAYICTKKRGGEK